MLTTATKTPTLTKTDVQTPSLDKVLEKFICTEIVAKDPRDTDTGTSGDDRTKDD
jgi:hypothetical protein